MPKDKFGIYNFFGIAVSLFGIVGICAVLTSETIHHLTLQFIYVCLILAGGVCALIEFKITECSIWACLCFGAAIIDGIAKDLLNKQSINSGVYALIVCLIISIARAATIPKRKRAAEAEKQKKMISEIGKRPGLDLRYCDSKLVNSAIEARISSIYSKFLSGTLATEQWINAFSDFEAACKSSMLPKNSEIKLTELLEEYREKLSN